MPLWQAHMPLWEGHVPLWEAQVPLWEVQVPVLQAKVLLCDVKVHMHKLPKINKGVTASGHPQSRPVVTAATGLSSRSGDILSDFLGPFVLLENPRMDDQSTEEVLSQLKDTSEEIRRLGSLSTMVGSLNVKSLYPSLNQCESARIVVEVSGLDYRL